MSSTAPPPRVTVCIPTYNRSTLLARTLESVLAQTYPDFVVAVADNASTDDTASVVASYGDRRIRYLPNARNLGAAANFNVALGAAETDFALLLCDDDLLRPEHLERCVAELDAHPRAGFVHTAFDVVDATDRAIATVDWRQEPRRDTVESARAFLVESMRRSCRVCLSTALIRREALPAGGFRVEDFPALDFRLWLDIAAAGWDAAFLARPLGAFRVHDASESAARLGPPYGAGYPADRGMVQRARGIKLSVLREREGELEDAPALRALAEQCARREAVGAARNRTLDHAGLRFRRARFIARAAANDPSTLLLEHTWRTLVADIRRSRATPGGAREAEVSEPAPEGALR
jgi:glycosyltransferase involved in cell wall biosynthesis